MNRTNELDTYDMLKYDHIPIKNLMDYATEKHKYDFSQFVYDDIEEKYVYTKTFQLLWDGDFFDISLWICSPDEFEDEQYAKVHYFCDIIIDNEEKRNFPPFPDISLSQHITTRENFIEVLQQWDDFVAKSYMTILSYRLDMLECLDNIVATEQQMPNKRKHHKTLKRDYHTNLAMLPIHLANDIEDIRNLENGDRCD
jgi:hypothetical protein